MYKILLNIVCTFIFLCISMAQFLHEINSVQEAPPDSYLIYNISGGIYYISYKNYTSFASQWIGKSTYPHLTMDLCSTRAHSLILDLDYKLDGTCISQDILDSIEAILKMVFIPSVPNFTYIIACRKNSAGIHVHLPEFLIAHDDYILFCGYLQNQLINTLKNKKSYELDILQNAMLSGASKPKMEPYMPIRITYVDEKNTLCYKLKSEVDCKNSFKRRKDNEKSLFRYLLNCNSKMFHLQLKCVMMPIVTGYQPLYYIMYNTTINNTIANADDYITIATFTTNHSNENGYIHKHKKLIFNGSQFLRSYHYLKLNSRRITHLETNNQAIKTWYKMFHVTQTDHSHIPERFQEIHQILISENTTFMLDSNPIKTILQYNNGYYFLPVFYTFCQHFHVNPSEIIQDLFEIVDPTFHTLLLRLQELDHKIISYSKTDLTIKTLYFCGNNLYPQPTNMQDKIKLIIQHNKCAILSVTTDGQMIELLRNIQEKHFPIRLLKLRNGLKKPSRYIWNFLKESWQEIGQSGEITNHLSNVWTHIKTFLTEHKKSGNLGGPDESLVDKFNINSVVSSILSDTTIERIDVQMDMHKWFIRLQDGALDLLTGHIGGVVPEFFLSDQNLGLDLSRTEMDRLCNNASDLEDLYKLLIDKPIFFKYMKDLYMDVTDDLYSTLYNIIMDNMSQLDSNTFAQSMINFYVNLCKYMCFEYDMILYLMDVLASIFIATNYERKFFVFKGLTCNGKSKMFELMGRVLGGYYKSIQSENLTPTNSINNPNPELASTLFSCRMVASEELGCKLNENRVKQITGNSFVTFRNMYEQNTGGIPTAKIFATTNNYPECKASDAFKDRVVAIPFEATFVENPPLRTSEQIINNIYGKNAFIIEDSYQGCFLMLYYHLKHNISTHDGHLHYRAEPEYIKEFTEDYLIHADIYVQFKIHMDVQILPGCTTTMNDVRSAVRQFLKGTKNTSFHETDLFMKFEEEFGMYRKTDIQLGEFDYISMTERSLLGEPNQKQTKLDENALVYFDGVVIKNLKRNNIDL